MVPFHGTNVRNSDGVHDIISLSLATTDLNIVSDDPKKRTTPTSEMIHSITNASGNLNKTMRDLSNNLQQSNFVDHFQFLT